MLSRAAERAYWAGRYLERAENTARIVQQYSQLLLDLPDEVEVGWHELMQIFGASDLDPSYDVGDDELAILEFLLSDPMSSSSLNFTIRTARDNIRNLRDLLPQESWECVNELHQYARQQLQSTAAGEDRFEVLSECIGRCQQINGVIAGTMSHDNPYAFLTMGQSIERADMTSRIIDVAAAYLQQNERLVLRYGSTLWTNVLKSVSGFQMYRQYVKPAVEGVAVVDFLLNDEAFPRSVRASILSARKKADSLPQGDPVLHALDKSGHALPSPLPDDLDGKMVSEMMDTLQKRLAAVHNAVVDTWFLPAD